MLKALHYCHKVIGVVHRDIKPDNIMINNTDEAVLIDFGISTTLKIEDNDNINELLKLKTGAYFFYAPELFKKFFDKS
jgi:serine/threonine protein kinase